MTDETIEIELDVSKIPVATGKIIGTQFGNRLYIKSMRSFKIWVMNKLQQDSHADVRINVRGPMSNCIALQIGLWVAGYGVVVYHSNTGFHREMI